MMSYDIRVESKCWTWTLFRNMYASILVKIQQQIISKVDGVFIFYYIVFIDTLVQYVGSFGLETM